MRFATILMLAVSPKTLRAFVWKPNYISILLKKTLKTALPFLIILLFACSLPERQDASIFVVTNAYKSLTITDSNLNIPPPPPPPPFYLKHHFLIDSVGQLYYYQLDNSGWFCGTGYDYKTPSFIGLEPTDMIQLPEKGIEEFVSLNIFTDETEERAVAVASLKDTITAASFFSLQNALKDSSSKVRLAIRLATQEEAVVLRHKQKHERYLPNLIQWDSSKIKFILTPFKKEQ